jgi:hypothetical protein
MSKISMPENPVYDQDAIIETINKTITAFRQHLPLTEYDLYAELLRVRDILTVRRDAGRQKYQQKADYHRENTKQWRKDNHERNKAYQEKWKGKHCQCPNKNMDNWHVVGKSIKRKSTPTAYLVKCIVCNSQWRTRAGYCEKLKTQYNN